MCTGVRIGHSRYTVYEGHVPVDDEQNGRPGDRPLPEELHLMVKCDDVLVGE